MAVLSDRQLEKTAVKFICNGSAPSNKLLASLSVDNFHNKYTREAFQRIQTFAKQRSEIISWSDLLHDPALSKQTREALALHKKKLKINETVANGIIRNLENYRKQRVLYDHHKQGSEELSSGKIDLEKVADSLADTAAKLRGRNNDIISVNVGHDDNSLNIVKRILKSQGMPVIATGFNTFDSRNRGFFLGSAVALGGYTGAGKTALADQMASNMANRGFKVCQVSLEMSEDELTTRKMARVSRTDLTKLIDPANKLNKTEKQNIYKAWQLYSRKLAKKGGVENIRVPQEDVSIEEILFTLRPYGYDVIIVDYVTLLKGTDGDDQWRKLGAIFRFCKIFARTNKCVVIMLCQVNPDGTIRYSKAMAEHANNAWIFTRDQDFDETKLLHVKQLKARMGEQFDFDLFAELSLMTITDVDPEYIKKLESRQKKEEKSKVKKKELKEDEWLKDI